MYFFCSYDSYADVIQLNGGAWAVVASTVLRGDVGGMTAWKSGLSFALAFQGFRYYYYWAGNKLRKNLYLKVFFAN